MDIILQKMEEFLIVELKGKVNTLTSPILEKRLLELITDHQHNLLIDFSQSDYISSAGLRVLLIALKQLKTVHGRVVLCGQNKCVKEVFDITGFSQLFKIFPTRAEAVKELTQVS
ncbi:MAG: anti-sigma factor antagonist [Calditrichaeota bacterium]|nr:MAG: anti-sigma factor antagonist [Calditrichota bacterium]